MISGFACACHGLMEDELNKSYSFFEAGTHRDGWFTNKDLVAQFLECEPLFKRLHPECDLLISFDNSMTHHARAPDGLDVSLLNFSDGGSKQREKIKDGWYVSADGLKVNQSMFKADGKTQKGVQTILSERKKNLNSKGHALKLICAICKKKASSAERAEAIQQGVIDQLCCGTYVLSNEPDFLEQEEWLTEVVKGKGWKIIFFPKYHCELNFIEMIWGWLKSYFRRNCKYNYNILKTQLPIVIKEKLPIRFIRKAARHCLRFMSGYRQGLEGPKLDYAMKLYSSHRRIPAGVTAESLDTGYRANLKKNNKKHV